jgi:hypothetical protein
MRWWSATDPRFLAWRSDGRKTPPRAATYDEEACYAVCPSCGAALCAVTRFREVVPESLVAVVREGDWPDEFLK